MLKLTKRSVEALKPNEKDYIAFDGELPGFGVRIKPSGKRIFLIHYRIHGRSRRVTLGRFGPVTAEVARREAMRLLGEARGLGSDPAAARDFERRANTITQLGERFLDQHSGSAASPPPNPNTAARSKSSSIPSSASSVRGRSRPQMSRNSRA